MIGNGHAGFGRAASEKDPQGHLAGVVPRRAAIPARSSGDGRAQRVREAMRAWRARYGTSAVLVRLVAHARTPARGTGAGTTA